MIDVSQLAQKSPTMIALSLFLTAIAFIYRDLAKDYFRQRLKIRNEQLQNYLGSMGTVDVIEGKYHLLARQLVSIAFSVAKSIDRSQEIDPTQVLRDLKINMSEVFSRTVSALHHYTYNKNGNPLDLHLRLLSPLEKISFYGPIVEIIINTDDREQIRNTILAATDDFITQALNKIFEEKE